MNGGVIDGGGAGLIPGFVGATLDRADAWRGDADRMTEAAGMLSARLLRLDGLDPDVDSAGDLVWGSMAEAGPDAELVFLGLDNGRPRWAAVPPPGARIDVRSRSVWRVLAFLPPDQLALYGTARSLIDWHSRHRFCANCGAPTRIAKGGWQRDCAVPANGGCGAQHFPRTDPVVIMLAEHDGHALVGRQAAWPRGNMSALAGFIEPGEAMEEAVARELHEEAGVRVVPGGVRYVASQPWPFPSQLMIGCVAEVAGRDIIIDHNELETAMWVSKSDVRAALRGEDGALFKAPPPFAIAHNLLMHWATS